jgi:putative transposase
VTVIGDGGCPQWRWAQMKVASHGVETMSNLTCRIAAVCSLLNSSFGWPSRTPLTAVSQVVGFIKGKSAIHIARVYGERKRNFVGQSFWARGFFVSTVGRDEAVIREYIKSHEAEDNRLEQLSRSSERGGDG